MCIINDFVLNNCTACDILQKNKKRKKHGAFDFALTADSDIANNGSSMHTMNNNKICIIEKNIRN